MDACTWDPSSEATICDNDKDTFQALKRARTGPWYAPDDYQTVKQFRHTDTTRLQWLDLAKFSRVWPDPPIANRAFSMEAFMGTSVGDQWTFKRDSGAGMYLDKAIFPIALSLVAEQDMFGFRGLVLGSEIIHSWFGHDPYLGGFFEFDSNGGNTGGVDANRVGNLPLCRFEFPTNAKSGTQTSLRHIYEPHFISHPFPNGMSFNREGLQCTFESVQLDPNAVPIAAPRSYGAYADRISYVNERADNRDFGVTQTMKVPTGGIGGNPFWLKDTKDWPDILASLHFDFMPFLTPTVPTRPITYRFWDTLLSTAVFGGPTFSIVLDDYGIFDGEYYQMVMRHYGQSETQIHYWRQSLSYTGRDGKEVPLNLKFDERAGYPKHYINPHAYHMINKVGNAGAFDPVHSFNFMLPHPFFDVPDADAYFRGSATMPAGLGGGGFGTGAFTMSGWTGICPDLCFSPTDSNIVDDKGQPLPRFLQGEQIDAAAKSQNKQDLYRPYWNSQEELPMGDKRKLHEQNNNLSNPEACQDFYYTFLSASTDPLLDSFAFTRNTDGGEEATEPLMAESLSHELRGTHAGDIPFFFGTTPFKILTVSSADETASSISPLFDKQIGIHDASQKPVKILYPAIKGATNRKIVDALTKIQSWAWTKLAKFTKDQLDKVLAGLEPILAKNFPKTTKVLFTFARKFVASVMAKNGFNDSTGLMSAAQTSLDTNFGKLSGGGWSAVVNLAKSETAPSLAKNFSQELWTYLKKVKNQLSKTPIPEGDIEMVDMSKSDMEMVRVTTKMPSEIADGKIVTGITKGEEELAEGVKTATTAIKDAEKVAEGAVDAEKTVAKAAEVATTAAGEGFLSSVAAPVAIALIITFALQAWEENEEREAKLNADQQAVGEDWRSWDTLRVPFKMPLDQDATKLQAKLNSLIRNGAPSPDAHDVSGAYTMGNDAMAKFAGWEAAGNMDYDFTKISVGCWNMATEWAYKMRETGNWPVLDRPQFVPGITNMDDTTRIVALRDFFLRSNKNVQQFQLLVDLGLMTFMDLMMYSSFCDSNYTGASDRLLDFDPASPTFGGDLRTVANLIGMNHLCLDMVDVDRLINASGSNYASTKQQRALELLSVAEIIRTLRVVDYYMRASTWSMPVGDWRRFPPMRGIGASLLKQAMTPIPLTSPFDYKSASTDLESGIADINTAVQALDSIREEWTALNEARDLESIYDRVDDVNQGSAPPITNHWWTSLVEARERRWGVCPTHITTEIKNDDGTSYFHREIPVPVFAPGRSPTMFVSSADATFAWPTLTTKGVRMSALNNELKYFTDYGYCSSPFGMTWDTDPQDLTTLAWSSTGQSCKPTLGYQTARFLLHYEPPTPGEVSPGPPDRMPWSIVNDSTLPVVLVARDATGAYLMTRGPFAQGTVDNSYEITKAHGYWGKLPFMPDDNRVASITNTYFFVPRSIYPADATANSEISRVQGYIDLWAQNPKFRSIKFTLNGSTVGAGGTITIMDNEASYPHIILFEANMRAMSDLLNNGCNTALSYFYTHDFPMMSISDPGSRDAICQWLNTKIKLAMDTEGKATIMPSTFEEQVMFHSLFRQNLFNASGEKYELRSDAWENAYATAPTSVDFIDVPPITDACGIETLAYPPTTAKFGLTFVDKISLMDRAIQTTSNRIAYGLPISSDIATAWADAQDDYGDIDYYWSDDGGDVQAHAQRIAALNQTANDILNNNADLYDACIAIQEMGNPPQIQADYMDLFKKCEAIRVLRITAASQLAATEALDLAQAALSAYVPTGETGMADAVTTLRYIFEVRKNPNIVTLSKEGLSKLSPLHRLLAQLCKDTYEKPESQVSRAHPKTKEPAYIIKTGELATTLDYNVYHMPSLVDMPGRPTLIVAFRGTDVEKDVFKFFGHKALTRLGAIATMFEPMSDLVSDLNVFQGTQADTDRFTASAALIDLISAKYSSYNLILTGHSLGGSIAVHLLQKAIAESKFASVSLIGVVFNPGRGADAQYFFDVMSEIDKPNPKAWHSRLTTHHVGGESSWPYDDDPVSVLSMGLGKVFLYEGPGVPTYIDAHSSTNFVTKDVKVFSGSSILPTPSKTGPVAPAPVTGTSVLIVTQVQAVLDASGAGWNPPPMFSAAIDLQERGLSGTVVPGSETIDTSRSTPVMTYRYIPTNSTPSKTDPSVTPTPSDKGPPVTPTPSDKGPPVAPVPVNTPIKITTNVKGWMNRDDGQFDVPSTFNAAADLQSRGLYGTIVPNSTRVEGTWTESYFPVVTYMYIPISPITITTQVEAEMDDDTRTWIVPSTFNAANDLQSRGKKGTIVPNSTKIVGVQNDAGYFVYVQYQYLPSSIP